MTQFTITSAAFLTALLVDRLISVAVAGIAMWRFKRLLSAKTIPEAAANMSAVNPRWVESEKARQWGRKAN